MPLRTPAAACTTTVLSVITKITTSVNIYRVLRLPSRELLQLYRLYDDDDNKYVYYSIIYIYIRVSVHNVYNNVLYVPIHIHIMHIYNIYIVNICVYNICAAVDEITVIRRRQGMRRHRGRLLTGIIRPYGLRSCKRCYIIFIRE